VLQDADLCDDHGLDLRLRPLYLIRVLPLWHESSKARDRPAESLSSGDLRVCRCDALRSWNGPDTVGSYSSWVFGFLKWFGARHESLEQVSLLQIDDFLASKRAAG
jgi:hypothetical protein